CLPYCIIDKTKYLRYNMACPNKASCPHLGCTDACDPSCQALCGPGLTQICTSRCPPTNPLYQIGGSLSKLSQRIFGNPGDPTNTGIIPATLQGAGNQLSSAGQGAGGIFGQLGGTGPFGLPWVVLLA